MRLDTEMRIQAAMLVATAIGLIGVLILLVTGFVYGGMPHLLVAGVLLFIVFIIVSIGQSWTQRTMDRIAKIKRGDGDKADLEWLKSRKNPGFKKVVTRKK